MFEDDSKEPIIHVPAFNWRYYHVGQPVRVIKMKTPSESFWGIVQSVEHQCIFVATVFKDGDTTKIAINLSEVLAGHIKLENFSR